MSLSFDAIARISSRVSEPVPDWSPEAMISSAMDLIIDGSVPGGSSDVNSFDSSASVTVPDLSASRISKKRSLRCGEARDEEEDGEGWRATGVSLRRARPRAAATHGSSNGELPLASTIKRRPDVRNSSCRLR